MSIKQFKSKVNSDGTICLPEELDIGEGTEVNVILMEAEEEISSSEIARLLKASNAFDFLEGAEEDIYSKADGILG
ncbi:MAG: hypothetical protein ABEI54_03425 [Candidatus Bipolaricaulia bacterium]